MPCGNERGCGVPMSRAPWRGHIAAARLVPSLAFLFGSVAAVACDTPVYRYAMYNWEPAAYDVYCVHRGELDSETAAANRAISERAERGSGPVNVRFTAVDLADPVTLERIRADIADDLRLAQDEPHPLYMVYAPNGNRIFAGRSDAAELVALLDSPARRQVCELLNEGCACVFAILANRNSTAANGAAATVREVIDRAALGEISPAAQPGDLGTGGDERVAAEPQTATEPPRLVSVMVDKNDPAEAWFLRMLLGVEADLATYDAPMVFAIYGRGRAMEPWVGKGITPENLAEGVSFLIGSCSCQVKEENPGTDLLMSWNWESTAAALAERVGPETGNEDLLAPSGTLLRDHESRSLPLRDDSGPRAVGEKKTSAAPAQHGKGSDGSQVGEALVWHHDVRIEVGPLSFSGILLRRMALVVGVVSIVLAVGTLLVVRNR